MIKINKGVGPSEILDSKNATLEKNRMKLFYEKNNREQSRFKFALKGRIDVELKRHLHTKAKGKCMYCETKIESPDFGIAERFRPHNGVREKKDYFKDLYWWQTYEWDNIQYSCKECSQYKANYFPINGERALTPEMSLENEKHLLINPSLENPFQHLLYDDDGIYQSIDLKGVQTIELLRLNRDTLVRSRVKQTIEIKNTLEQIVNNKVRPSEEFIRRMQSIFDLNSEEEFLFAKHSVLSRNLEIHPLLQDILSIQIGPKSSDYTHPFTPGANAGESIINTYFGIEYITIHNFKNIDNITIDFTINHEEDEGWVFFLGENGMGKSTILQAIALGLKNTISNEDPIILHLIKRGKQESKIIIKERGFDNKITTIINRKNKTIEQKGTFNSRLVGYGSHRLLKQEGLTPESSQKHVRYMNMFKPTVCLNDSIQWLTRKYKSNTEEFNLIAYAVKELLPQEFEEDEENDNKKLTVHKGNLVFEENPDVPITSYSDGYKSIISLALDIIMSLSDSKTDINKLSGIVLIDEIGNQLHPRWQMIIVSKLREVFRNIQFIVSSHHPLCLRGIREGETKLVRRIDDEICVMGNLPSPSEFRVDQLLASEFFGLNSLSDPKTDLLFNTYYRLLNKKDNLTPEESDQLKDLMIKLKDQRHLGVSLREELMYSVIDELIASKVVFSKEFTSRTQLKKEVVERVKEIWESLNTEE